MASRQFLHIIDTGVQDGPPDAFRSSLANPELSTIVLHAGVHLAELVYGEGVPVAAADLLDELIRQVRKIFILSPHALHRGHLLAADEVFEA